MTWVTAMEFHVLSFKLPGTHISHFEKPGEHLEEINPHQHFYVTIVSYI